MPAYAIYTVRISDQMGFLFCLAQSQKSDRSVGDLELGHLNSGVRARAEFDKRVLRFAPS